MGVVEIVESLKDVLIDRWVELRSRGGTSDYLKGLQDGYFQGLEDAAKIHMELTTLFDTGSIDPKECAGKPKKHCQTG